MLKIDKYRKEQSPEYHTAGHHDRNVITASSYRQQHSLGNKRYASAVAIVETSSVSKPRTDRASVVGLDLYETAFAR